MPFGERKAEEERIELFKELDTGAFTISELCRRYGISRGLFYVWMMRRDSGRARWFVDLSHAVGHCPHATAADLTGRIVATRQPFPHCGPKKIRAWLSNRAPGETWPAASTIADILKREGLVEPRRRQRRPLAQGEIVAPAVAANECQWAIDFKGHFRTASGVRCDPLTVTDQASRYLLEVRIIEPTTVGVKRALERVFGAAGLPDAIHSDKRRTVRFDRRRRSVVTVGVVAEARHRAALHSAGEPAGQRPA